MAGEAPTEQHAVRFSPHHTLSSHLLIADDCVGCSAGAVGYGHGFEWSRTGSAGSGHTAVSVVSLIATALTENHCYIRTHKKKRVCRLLKEDHSSQLLSIRPSCTVTASDILEKLNIPDFLDNVTKHPSFQNRPGLTDGDMRFHLWNSVQVRVPTSRFAPEARAARIHAVSGLDAKVTRRKRPLVPRSDAIFYRPTNTNVNDELANIHGESHRDDTRSCCIHVNHDRRIRVDYRVGRLVLIFAVASSPDNLKPPMLAYVERFTKVSKAASSISGFHAVAKSQILGHRRYDCILLDQVVRPCPLAPIIKGPAARDVEGHRSLEHYQHFYINKYQNPHNYAWIHQS